MKKVLHLLALSLLLAFPCFAQQEEGAEEKAGGIQKATEPVMMKFENPRLVIEGEDDSPYLKLRATLKNISDKAIEIYISNDKRPPENGKPLYVLSEPNLWFYDKTGDDEEWRIMGLGGSFGETPSLKIGAGESIAFEATVPFAGKLRHFKEEKQESYTTQGLRFFLHATIAEEESPIVVAGQCKWKDPR